MSDEPESLVLVLLRRIDRNVADLQGRMGRIERRLALRDEDSSLDRLTVTELRERIERIERRLDIAP